MESVQELEKEINTKIIYFPELAKMAAGAEDVKYLCEAFELTEADFYGVTATGNSAVFTEGSNVYVQPLSSGILRKRTTSALSDWLNS